MVEIAKALAASATAAARQGHDAKILVMDEPTSALTSREVTQLFALIERLPRAASPSSTSRTGSTRSFGSAAITVMRDGRRVTTRPIDQVSVPELVRLMANRDLSEHFRKCASSARRAAARRRAHRTRRPLRHQLLAARRRGARHRGTARGGTDRACTRSRGGRSLRRRRLLVDGQPVQFRNPADAIAHGIGLLPEIVRRRTRSRPDRRTQHRAPARTAARSVRRAVAAM